MEKAIGALWLKQGRKGKFMSGEIEIAGTKYPVVIFKNDLKQPGEKTPDYRIFPAQPREPERAVPHADDDGDAF